MIWSEIRRHYREPWPVIEALDATSSQNRRHLEDITVVESCENGSEERPRLGIRFESHAASAMQVEV